MKYIALAFALKVWKEGVGQQQSGGIEIAGIVLDSKGDVKLLVCTTY